MDSGMKTQIMKQKIIKFIRHQPRWRLIVAGVVLLLLVVWAFKGGKVAEAEITFAAKRGDLDITVLEGGSIEALESQEVRSEVRGGQGTKILKIVEEGYVVTEEDVKTNKVLVELDSADLRDRIIQEEINYQSALATLTDASQGFDIQRNQNTSNIKAADDKALFARMDVEKYLGDKSAKEVIAILKLDEKEAAARKLASGDDAEAQMRSAMEKTDTKEKNDATNSVTNLVVSASQTNADGSTNATLPASVPVVKHTELIPDVDYALYAKPEALGDGSAMQDLRKDTDDLQSAKQQFGLAQTKLVGTKRLFEKGFSTKTELDTDQISYDDCQLKVKTAETAYHLFIKYEFPKQARDLISKFEESLRALEREKTEAIAKLAQAQAHLKGAEGRYNIECNQRKDLQEQLDKCVIKAERPGLVIYGGNSGDRFFDQEQIREGATVRERQPIITIPNMSRMCVKVKVHESYIQKISKGLKADITVDAFPNEKLPGEVIKVSVLPDSQNRWMNPDLKVYVTTVSINATNEWLKPGMSAKVVLMIKQLHDVICVPLQAVTETDGKHYCQVVNGKVEKREVEIGEFNDEFIEITKGIKAGERVSLRAPAAQVNASENGDEAAGGSKKKADTKSSAAPQPAEKSSH